jgi:hypothetical protein
MNNPRNIGGDDLLPFLASLPEWSADSPLGHVMDLTSQDLEWDPPFDEFANRGTAMLDLSGPLRDELTQTKSKCVNLVEHFPSRGDQT